MIKNGEIYQIGSYKYLITSDKGNHYIGCLISNDAKRKMLSNLNYYIPDCGCICCEHIKTLNTEDLTNKVGKVDDDMFTEIKSLMTKITMGGRTL